MDRLGAYGRIFIGTLTTKTLVIAGEVAMPAKQTGSPMTYLHDGKQYIMVAVSQSGANAGAELIAYALP